MFILKNIFRSKVFATMIILCIFVFTMEAMAQDKGPLSNKKGKTSYAIGANLGQDMKRYSIDIDADMVAQGIKDAFAGKIKLSNEEIRTTFTDLNNDRLKNISEKNKKEGEEFLSKNAKADGVVKLPSGLQYKVLTEGTGTTPKATDTVVVHYKGTLIDGTEFDSSFKRNQSVEFKVNGVIPGWTEILQKMKAGSKYTVFIPSNLAYGEKGSGIIGPNSVLVFEIELLAVK